jgi:hypothetical protein
MPAFTATITPGKQFADGEAITNAKLNQLGQPSLAIVGELAALSNVSATVPTTGQPLVWDGTDWAPGTVTAANLTAMVGATASTAGVKGVVPAPSAGEQEEFLRGDGTWQPAPQPAGVALAQWAVCF